MKSEGKYETKYRVIPKKGTLMLYNSGRQPQNENVDKSFPTECFSHCEKLDTVS